MKLAPLFALSLFLGASPCLAAPILVVLAPPEIGPGLEDSGPLEALAFEALAAAGIRAAGPRWLKQWVPTDMSCASPRCWDELRSQGAEGLLQLSWAKADEGCRLSLTVRARYRGFSPAQASVRAACSAEGLAAAVPELLGGLFPAEALHLKRAIEVRPKVEPSPSPRPEPDPRTTQEDPRQPGLGEHQRPAAGERSSADHSVPKTDLPPRDAPPRDAPPREAPPRDAPPRDAPPHDAPPRDAPPRDAPPPLLGRAERSLEDRLASDPRLTPSREARSMSGLKAGAADDNLQFGAFLRFLAETEVPGPRRDLSQRWIITVRDPSGAPVANAKIQAFDGEQLIVERTTYADGRALLFPSEHPALRSPRARLLVRAGTEQRSISLEGGRRLAIDVKLDQLREAPRAVPLDVVFVLDTTASMGDEIDRIKQTIDQIRLQISQIEPRPDVRFGMVLYRDQGDEAPTQIVPLSPDGAEGSAFRAALAKVEAGGGGDTPEDVQSALEDLVTKMAWRAGGVRLAFLIGDAPPHFDYGQTYTYQSAASEAARQGIKIAAIGCSGLDLVGEAVWRQVAQYTNGPFVFLTRGESGDAEGSASSVSHHVGSNWLSGNLDALIVKTIKLELSHFSARGAPRHQDYFEASASAELSAPDVLDELFRQSVAQLIDYALVEVSPATPTMLLPITARARPLKRPAELLDPRLAVALGRSRSFRLIERDGAALDRALAEQFAAGFDESKMVELGKRVPARLAIVSELGRGAGQLEVLLRLVKLETGEVLSVSLLKISDRLLL